jgi:hypothetical protein
MKTEHFHPCLNTDPRCGARFNANVLVNVLFDLLPAGHLLMICSMDESSPLEPRGSRNISVYEGGCLRLSVNDEADLLKPGRNGVISTKGVLLKLNYAHPGRAYAR